MRGLFNDMGMNVLVFYLKKEEIGLISEELLEFLFKRYTLSFVGEKSLIQGLERYFDDGIFDRIDNIAIPSFVFITNQHFPDLKTISFQNEQQLKDDLLGLQPQQRFLNKKMFKCTKCGECCRPIVKVDEEDIRRIESVGYQRKDFLDYDPLERGHTTKDTLRQKKNVCMFLKRKGEEFICSIYDSRPRNCRIYPFHSKNQKLEDCIPTYLRKPESLREIFRKRAA